MMKIYVLQLKNFCKNKATVLLKQKNGKVGIELLEKEENLPDLILLDLMMPEMNGFEFLNQIKGTKLKIYSCFSFNWSRFTG